jgi:hypothetical protein
MACKKTAASKEEATKAIIANLFDACKAGKNEEAAKQANEIMPETEKNRGRAIDVSTPEGKQQAERMCTGLNNLWGNGYEFVKGEAKGDAVAWNVFPKGKNEGQIWAFREVNGHWTLVDLDPAKR